MKKSLFILFLFSTALLMAQPLTHVIGLPEGFASMNGGVTGGEGGPVVTVTTEDELKAAVDGVNTATIILVKGTINVSGELSARGNKTIVGLGTDARIEGGGFGWNTKTNVIVQNITFEDASDDLLKINNKCMNFWIDHCTFSDGDGTYAGSHDGMLDVTRGSQYVTISYNKFFNHDKNILIGHSDSESGDVIMKVTLHHNWFDKTIQRNPRVRYATVHCYNNYYVANSIYSVASACNANVLVENCYFKDAPIPLQVGVPEFSPAGFLVQRGCFFENSGVPQIKEKDMTGLFPYPYTLDSVKYVPCIAETYVGAAKPYKTKENFKCDAANTIQQIVGKTTSLSFTNNTLVFRSDITCPAEIKIVGIDGKTLDIPFRGWIEGGVENKLLIKTDQLSKGVYLFMLTTGKESSVIKFKK
jgi:pectate lyase